VLVAPRCVLYPEGYRYEIEAGVTSSLDYPQPSFVPSFVRRSKTALLLHGAVRKLASVSHIEPGDSVVFLSAVNDGITVVIGGVLNAGGELFFEPRDEPPDLPPSHRAWRWSVSILSDETATTIGPQQVPGSWDGDVPFLRAIVVRLSDRLPRAIYADWLEDHGRVAEAVWWRP
jgi:uncharacterized protein (TIGR02996 family)